MRSVLPKNTFWCDSLRVNITPSGKCFYCKVAVYDFWESILIREGYDRGVRYFRNNQKYRNSGRAAKTKDHIHPKSKGGKLNNGNCANCCYQCNQDKSDKNIHEYYLELDKRKAKR